MRETREQLAVFAEVALRQIFLDDPLLGLDVWAGGKAEDFLASVFKQVNVALAAHGTPLPLSELHFLTASGNHGGYFALALLVGESERVGEAMMAALMVPTVSIKKAQAEGKPFSQRPRGNEIPARYLTLEYSERPSGKPPRTTLCEWSREGRRLELGVGPTDVNPEGFFAAIVQAIGAAPH